MTRYCGIKENEINPSAPMTAFYEKALRDGTISEGDRPRVRLILDAHLKVNREMLTP